MSLSFSQNGGGEGQETMQTNVQSLLIEIIWNVMQSPHKIGISLKYKHDILNESAILSSATFRIE